VEKNPSVTSPQAAKQKSTVPTLVRHVAGNDVRKPRASKSQITPAAKKDVAIHELGLRFPPDEREQPSAFLRTL
jgi:hypothetical protein